MSPATRLKPGRVGTDPGPPFSMRPCRDRILVMAWAAAVGLAMFQAYFLLRGSWGWDSSTYWAVWSQPAMYRVAPHTQGAYLYSPAFAQVLYPLTLLPRSLFMGLWFGFGACAYYWLIRPVGWVWGIPLLALAAEDLRVGNITWLIALSVVLGLRRSPAWVVAAFTKVTPAVVVLWLAAQRQWQGLLAVGAAALAVGTVSLSLAPRLWVEWIAFLMSHGNTWALARLVVAAVIVIIASRRGWPWLLPCALIAASPVPALYVLGFVCLLPRVLSGEALAWLREPFGGVWATAKRALTPSRSRRLSRDMDRRVEAISAMHTRDRRVAGASPAPSAGPR